MDIKQETAPDSQAPTGQGGVKGLEDLKIEIDRGDTGATAAPRSGRRGRPSARQIEPPPPTPEEIKKELEPMIDMVIGIANSYFIQAGVTALNPLQETLIKTGLVGVCLKYNMTLDDQPELLLSGGLLWVGADKYQEIKRIKQAKQDPTKQPPTASTSD